MKICGLTRREDIDLAIALGADVIGIVCEPSSPRYAARELRVQLVAGVAVPVVAVFGPFLESEVSKGSPQDRRPPGLHFTSTSGAGLTGQTSSEERNNQDDGLERRACSASDPYLGAGPDSGELPQIYSAVQTLTPVSKISTEFQKIQTLKLHSLSQLEEIAGADAVLLEPAKMEGYGGSGITADWELARRFVENCPIPVWLAGGLTSENIEEAIRTVKPFGVDVSSGVESEPGIKDPEKLKNFIERAKRTEV